MAKRRRNVYGRPDHLTRAAKAAGYVARSVYKLEEIDRRARLLKPSQRVLDLGAAPGSWSAYAAKKIGKRGTLVAIDLQPLRQPLPAQCSVLQGDILDLTVAAVLRARGPYDVVLSDMAPNTSGDRKTDQLRSMELFTRAVELANQWLTPGGHFVGKLFMSGDFPAARDHLRKCFKKVRTMRPEAVRSVSYEVFLVGLERR